jgi:hypothetical protein
MTFVVVWTLHDNMLICSDIETSICRGVQCEPSMVHSLECTYADGRIIHLIPEIPMQNVRVIKDKSGVPHQCGKRLLNERIIGYRL